MGSAFKAEVLAECLAKSVKIFLTCDGKQLIKTKLLP